MNNHATVFSAESAEIAPRKFAIVRLNEKSADKHMPPRALNPLQEYLLRVMREENLSFQKIEDNARDNGGTLGRATIRQIATGSTTNPGIFTLVELSWGIKRPLEEVVKVTLGDLIADPSVFDKSSAGRLWNQAEELPPADQRFIKRSLQLIERELERLLRGD